MWQARETGHALPMLGAVVRWPRGNRRKDKAMALVQELAGPQDLAGLTAQQLEELAGQIRTFLVENVSKTGGHLGPNLGVVELSVAIHRVFDSPKDAVLFDTGHQGYVHKILTGRAHLFPQLRKEGGLSGYPSRAESAHDVIENSHASTALSYADGIAKAWAVRGEKNRSVVVVVGDGAMTGGMTWEALNNLAAQKDLPVVIVLNDNARSYSPTIGGLAQHLARLRTARGYETAMHWGRGMLERTPVVGQPMFEALHGVKRGIKDVITPEGLFFEDVGLKYLGPVDGHDVVAMEQALRRAQALRTPVVVHAITEKGRGFAPAETDQADHFHAVGVIDPETGEPLASSTAQGSGQANATWTSVFSREVVQVAAQREDVVAITAAMCAPVGLDEFARTYPQRFFDVGIAEQHAITSAVGMAFAGLHPVVAMYATFLNRAFDQVLMDAALHRAGITIVLDRAGVTGDDGPSHNGVWDLAWLQAVPGLQVACPRDASQLRALLREAVGVSDAPTVLRYPKGLVGLDVPRVASAGSVDILARPVAGLSTAARVLIVTVGPMASVGVQAGKLLAQQAIAATVVDPRWVQPLPVELVDLAAEHDLVITVEDGLRHGGVGAALGQLLPDAHVRTPLITCGVREGFLEQAKRDKILADNGLTAPAIAEQVVTALGHHARETVWAALPGGNAKVS